MDDASAPGQDKFLAAQPPIDALLPGGFRFGGQHNGMSHVGSLIGLPGRTQAWRAPNSAFDLTANDLAVVLAQAENLDLVVVGTGDDIAVLPADTLAAFREVGMGVEVSATRAAVRTYNVLLSEDRRVAAALMATT